jgi:hypothetical protein
MSVDTNFDATYDDTGQSPVERLITALRSLAEQFMWNFRSPKTCALQVCRIIGMSHSDVFSVLNIHWEHPDNPFRALEHNGLVPLYGVPARSVTPAMVADALERLVSAGDH